MKREFLQNIKIGDQAMTPEIIDAIMAEYGKGIHAEQEKYADYESIKEQLEAAKKTIEESQKAGTTLEQVQAEYRKLEQTLKETTERHAAELAERDFNADFEKALAEAKGRNATAIRAVLDMESLKGSKNRAEDITVALGKAKKDMPYLFDDDGTPPPYAGGTGSASVGGKRYTQEELAAMSMDEYRKYRMGN